MPASKPARPANDNLRADLPAQPVRLLFPLIDVLALQAAMEAQARPANDNDNESTPGRDSR